MKVSVFNRSLLALTTSISITSTHLQAEQASPVIVTATRTAQTVDSSLASVTVITREEIEASQAKSVEQLLNGVAGIDITSSGGSGKSTSLFMRGTNSDHVLVMINGIKIGSATTGSISFANIPLEQIEHIEVVRGPRSSLYGSEAIGGVIQIFTRKGTEKTIVNAKAGAGSYNSKELSAGISGKTGDTAYSIQSAYFDTDNFSAQKTNNPDDDGYSNTSVSGSISHAFSNTTKLELSFMQAEGDNQYDGFTTSSDYTADSVLQTVGTSLTTAPVKWWQIKLSAEQSKDKSHHFADDVSTGFFNTRRTQFGWQNDFTINENNLTTIGIDSLEDEINSSSTYDETSRDNTGLYLQHQWNSNSNDITAGIRQDDNQAFGKHTTGNLAWGHSFSNKMRLITSYGTGFKAPTFNELYWPGAGDPNLKPEESESYEAELRSKDPWGQWSLSVYETNIDDLISGWPPANVNKAKIKGIETRIETTLWGWQTRLNAAFTDPRNTDTDKVLARRARQTIRLDLDKSYGNWTSGITWLAQSHRYDDDPNTTRLNGYGVINLRTEYVINKSWALQGKLDNLFDKEYETVDGYNTSDRSVFVSISYNE